MPNRYIAWLLPLSDDSLSSVSSVSDSVPELLGDGASCCESQPHKSKSRAARTKLRIERQPDKITGKSSLFRDQRDSSICPGSCRISNRDRSACKPGCTEAPWVR